MESNHRRNSKNWLSIAGLVVFLAVAGFGLLRWTFSGESEASAAAQDPTTTVSAEPAETEAEVTGSEASETAISSETEVESESAGPEIVAAGQDQVLEPNRELVLPALDTLTMPADLRVGGVMVTLKAEYLPLIGSDEPTPRRYDLVMKYPVDYIGTALTTATDSNGNERQMMLASNGSWFELQIPGANLVLKPSWQASFELASDADPAQFPVQVTETNDAGEVLDPVAHRDSSTMYLAQGKINLSVPLQQIVQRAALSSTDCIVQARTKLRNMVNQAIKEGLLEAGYGPELLQVLPNPEVVQARPFEVSDLEFDMQGLSQLWQWSNWQLAEVECLP